MTPHATPISSLASLCLCMLMVLLSPFAAAQEVIPPAPKTYFVDEARVVSRGVAQQLEQKLRQFERDSAIQLVVAIYPKMQSDSSIDDYAQRVAEKWGVGRKDSNSGVVLFVFTQDRQSYIATGYGVEGALPDALAKRIIENEIVPRFAAGDYGGGVSAGVDAIVAATRGEYRGTGRTVGEGQPSQGTGAGLLLFALILFFVIFGGASRRRRGFGYHHHGYGRMGGGFGRGGFGGGFGGGGGFRGGGGGFGGGGAGGRW